MSLSPDARFWHDQYEKSDPLIREAVDDCYARVATVLLARGFSVNRADAAEELVSAITKYLTESSES